MSSIPSERGMEMVPPGRIELPTSALPRMRSTTELRRPDLRKRPYSEKRSKGQAKSASYAAMSDKPPAPPPKDARAERQEALARALRANLRRRKAPKAVEPKSD